MCRPASPGCCRSEPKPLVRGSWDADVIDELKPAEGDRIIDKNRYDAFLYTDLEVVLRRWAFQRLLVTGVVTSVLCRVDGAVGEQRDFDPYVASDCNVGGRWGARAGACGEAAVFATVGPVRICCRTARAGRL